MNFRVYRVDPIPNIAAGDVVSICGPDDVEFARGLTRDGAVIVHRDDLVIL